tara:strand:+ start:129 stop:350 length:222 start_codon:yes stop_codon:yes gene_type:complete
MSQINFSETESINDLSDKDFLDWVEKKLLLVNHERYQKSNKGFLKEQLTLSQYLAENHTKLLIEYLQTEKGCV